MTAAEKIIEKAETADLSHLGDRLVRIGYDMGREADLSATEQCLRQLSGQFYSAGHDEPARIVRELADKYAHELESRRKQLRGDKYQPGLLFEWDVIKGELKAREKRTVEAA